MDCADTTARRDENHSSFRIWCVLYYSLYGSCADIRGHKRGPECISGKALNQIMIIFIKYKKIAKLNTNTLMFSIYSFKQWYLFLHNHIQQEIVD